MKVDLLEPSSRQPCLIGEICEMLRITFHGKLITHGHYSVVVIIIKKGLVKLSFLNEDVTRMKDVSLWFVENNHLCAKLFIL
jgi:hypothetical protein